MDEAHGAHFGFHSYFPETAVRLGADLVIQSLHKTLSCLTQTAVLHANTSLVSKTNIQKFLAVYQTSSPSYVLMAGIESCIRMIEEQGEELFASYVERLSDFYRQTNLLQKIKMLNNEKKGDVVWDFSKLLITGEELGLDGKKLYDLLLKDYHLQMEMCSGNYVLAMTSLMDTDEGFARLLQALIDIEKRAEGKEIQGRKESEKQKNFIEQVYQKNVKRFELADAWEREGIEIPLSESKGYAAGDFITLYPPGIPLLVPGEEITAEFIGNIRECFRLGLNVQGVSGNLRIKVVN